MSFQEKMNPYDVSNVRWEEIYSCLKEFFIPPLESENHEALYDSQ